MRVTQYSRDASDPSRGRGVLDAPPEPVIGLAEGKTRWRGMTTFSMVATPMRLHRAEALVESIEIDEAAGVAAFADLARAVEGGNLEADDAALHRDHTRCGAHGRADRRGPEMADIDLGADRDPDGFETGGDGVAGGELHFQDHHRGGEHHRHALQDMPDRALRRHHQGALGAHADCDDVACVHGDLSPQFTTTSSRRKPGPTITTVDVVRSWGGGLA